jgi:hypothetical protein
MNKREARYLLLRKLVEYRRYSYDQLLRKVDQQPDCYELKGALGTLYQVEVEVFWDDAIGGKLRVFAAVDDGRWRAFRPLAYSFLARPDSARHPLVADGSTECGGA